MSFRKYELTRLRGDARRAPRGRCRSATTSPSTCATSTRATSSRWSGRTAQGNERQVELRRAPGPLEQVRQRARGARHRARRPRGHAAALAARDRRRLPRHLQAAARSCCRCRCSTATRASSTGCATRAPGVLVTDAANRDRIPDGLVEQRVRGRRRSWSRRWTARARPSTTWSTPRPTTRRSSTTRRARPAWPRASCTPTATCWPTRSSSSATTCRTASSSTAWGEWAWAAGICAAARPVALRRHGARVRAQGRLRPRGAAALPRQARGAGHVHHAHRAARDDRDRGRGRALPADELRIVCSAGEPLNPEVIRWFRDQYGLTVLDYYGLTESYPLCGNFPHRRGARGLDGAADARLGRRDPRRGREARADRRARRDLPAARARTRTTRSATGTGPRTPRRTSAATGSTPRTRRRWMRTATSGTPAAPTT